MTQFSILDFFNICCSSPKILSEIQNEYLMFSPNYECVCLLGDFNSRTATDDDFIFIDDNDPSTEGIDIVNSVCFLDMHSLPRKGNSRDKTRNIFGKLLLDFCKSNDFFILNGRLNGDVEGKLTCKWEKWDPEKLQEFIENIETVKVIDLENKLINSNNDNTCKQSINQYVHDLSEIFVDSARKTLGTRTTKNSKQKINKSKIHKPWFTVQCKFQRQNYRKLKRKYKRYKTDAVKNELAAAERQYKRTLDTSMSRHTCRKDRQNKLKTMRTKNPKEF